MSRAEKQPSGVVLCRGHAAQAAQALDPSGPCSEVSWTGGAGQVVMCDVNLDRDAVYSYVSRIRPGVIKYLERTQRKGATT